MRLFRSPWFCCVLILCSFFWLGGEVVAQGTIPALFEQGIFTDSGGIDIGRIKSADAALKTLYLIMRPLLALAGAALDNTLVYGQGFYLDVTLFKFRQLIRTFTMFAIGFIFVGTILYAFFNPETAQQKIKDVVIKSLIATVVINMSRWIVAAMIDISTILVVSIGALPLQIMGDTEVVKDIRFLETHSYYDKVNTEQSDANEGKYSTVYSCPQQGTPVFFVSCEFAPVELPDGNTVNGLIPIEITSDPSLENTIISTLDQRGAQKEKIGMTLERVNKEYCVQDGALIQYVPESRINKCEEWQDLKENGRDAMKDIFNCHSFSELTRLAENTSGPLYTLYGSIFTLSNLPATTNYGNIGEVGIEMLMKIIVGAGLVIPLLAFAVVMIIRVVVLWLVIAFSPLLAMAYVYDFKKITEISDGKFTFQNILNLLMMPVLGVFALSISIVFLSLLNNVDYLQAKTGEEKSQKGGICYDDLATSFLVNSIERVETPPGITNDNDNAVCYKFLGIQTVCLNEGERIALGNVANTFTRLITNMLGIALMRMAVMAVLKTNKFTEGTVDFIDSTAKSIAKSTKIIPVPGIGAVSAGGAEQALSNLRRQIPQSMIQKAYQNDGMQAFVDKSIANINGVDEKVVATAKQGAEKGDASFVEGPKQTDADKFTLRDRESRGVPDLMGKAIQQEISREFAADPGAYPEEIKSALPALQNNISSFTDLLKNPAFVAYTRKKGYYDDFTKNRSGKDPQSRLNASRSFIGGFSQKPKISPASKDTQGFQDERYLHNGLATKVRRNPQSGMIDFDFNDGKGIESFDFPSFTASNVPTEPATKEEFAPVLEVIRKGFGNNIDEFNKTFSDGEGQNAPYQSILKGMLEQLNDSPQDVEIQVGGQTKYVTIESTAGENGRVITRIGTIMDTKGGTPPTPSGTPPEPETTPPVSPE